MNSYNYTILLIIEDAQSSETPLSVACSSCHNLAAVSICPG